MNLISTRRIFSILTLLCAGVAVAAPSERVSLDADWRFQKGDPSDAKGQLAYAKIKDWMLPCGREFTTNQDLRAKERPSGSPVGEDISYVKTDFDDTAWRRVELPHDWGVEGPFKQEYSGETAKLPWWGVAWYRRHLNLPASDQGRQIFLDVDGAMSYATVWVNGQFAGGWPYGYASWRIDLTPFAKFGADNVIAIRLDNPPDSSRWYPGGGIYRNVWLVKSGPVRIGHWGTYITTDHDTANLKVSVDNAGPADDLTVRAEIFELTTLDGGLRTRLGHKVSSATAPAALSLPAAGSAEASLSIVTHHPHLWSVEHPNLYAAVTTLERHGEILDRQETDFGFRTIEFSATNGFLLNGERVPLNGVCDHHDLGPLGAAINLRALQRQLEILREMGCNAIRTSHNPPAPELLDLADRMGFVVMDEIFDTWEAGKKKNDYHLIFADWHEKDWRAQLRRDRNHPCVILWSIGNEIPDQNTARGPVLAREMSDIAHQEDPTRPTTSACNETKSGYNDFGRALDVFGYNYKPFEYGKRHAAFPNQPIFGSETASCISSRGEYFFPISNNKADGEADFQVNSYDLTAPPWATPPSWEFKGQDEFPYVAGEFVWTGFDYLGEPTPYGGDAHSMLTFTDPAVRERMAAELKDTGRILVPSRSSYFGIIDLDGFKKDRFYLYQARWRPEHKMAHLLPHWSWPERMGQVTPVHVYTSGDEAELFLNGKSLGRKHKGQYEYRLRWDDVVYQPGVLKVVAYKNGKAWATDKVETAGPAARLDMQTDHRRLHADGHDLCFVTVRVTDSEKRFAPRAHDRIRFSVEGPGEIVATDNGDPTNLEIFSNHERNAFNGLCLVILRAQPGATGAIKLRAEADGLAPSSVTVRSVPANK
ncbi:MAG TPA: beta-galactosidase GalB [Verrucomicrobiae bacterium]|jgi:beta-galactosidase|nr:beta-galactosidase GalB [Verrucomicrobiae bacterium]